MMPVVVAIFFVLGPGYVRRVRSCGVQRAVV